MSKSVLLRLRLFSGLKKLIMIFSIFFRRDGGGGVGGDVIRTGHHLESLFLLQVWPQSTVELHLTFVIRI